MARAYKETTVWDSPSSPNHVYLLDGDKLIAFIPLGKRKPVYFKTPIKGFDRRGRTFVEVIPSPFKDADYLQHQFFGSVLPKKTREVKGSKGEVYSVNDEEGTCTCPGFKYRGACKHITELA